MFNFDTFLTAKRDYTKAATLLRDHEAWYVFGTGVILVSILVQGANACCDCVIAWVGWPISNLIFKSDLSLPQGNRLPRRRSRIYRMSTIALHRPPPPPPLEFSLLIFSSLVLILTSFHGHSALPTTGLPQRHPATCSHPRQDPVCLCTTPLQARVLLL